jgi:uncharacterized protein YyaL (SSP411 family)
MIAQFWDNEAGGFFFTSADHERLITRTKDFYDNAIPAGNSVAADVLIRLSLLTGEERYRSMADTVLKLMKTLIMRAPSAFGHLLCALDLHLSSPFQIAIIGRLDSPETNALVDEVFRRYVPNKVVAVAEPGERASGMAIKLLEGRREIGGRATAYVCRDFYCEAPTTEAQQLQSQLSSVD